MIFRLLTSFWLRHYFGYDMYMSCLRYYAIKTWIWSEYSTLNSSIAYSESDRGNIVPVAGVVPSDPYELPLTAVYRVIFKLSEWCNWFLLFCKKLSLWPKPSVKNHWGVEPTFACTDGLQHHLSSSSVMETSLLIQQLLLLHLLLLFIKKKSLSRSDKL